MSDTTGEDETVVAEVPAAKIAELKTKYGDRLFSVESPDGSTWILRRPPKATWSAVTADLQRPDRDRVLTFDRLTMECTVYPDRDAVIGVLEEYPAFSTEIFAVVSKMAGAVNGELSVKKL